MIRTAYHQARLMPSPVNRNLDADGCKLLAASMIYYALRDVKKGGALSEEAITFLWTDRAALFMDAAGYNPDFIREQLEASIS